MSAQPRDHTVQRTRKDQAAPERLADALRSLILSGQLGPGTPLREQAISNDYGLARHTVRAALRTLAAEGIVTIEPNRGARVTELSRDDLIALGELRIALEVEAARLALQRHGRLPVPVHAAARALRTAANLPIAHEELHSAIVAAAASPRIADAHRAISGQLRLFLVQLQPVWDTGNLAAEHQALLEAIEADGPDALRLHITDSTEALTSGLKF